MTMQDPKHALPTTADVPVGAKQHALTAATRGPLLRQDVYLTEVLARFCTAGGEQDSAESARGPRGVALQAGSRTPGAVERSPARSA